MKYSHWFQKIAVFSLIAGCLTLTISCDRQVIRETISFPKTDLAAAPLIPKPLEMIPDSTAFGLDRFSAVYYPQEIPGFEMAGEFLAGKLRERTGLGLPVNPALRDTAYQGIHLEQTANLEGEAYRLKIGPNRILLSAGTPEGAFRGVQTLRQLLPDTANDTLAEFPVWVIPGGEIKDAPRYAYRGAMLDVARHFFTVESVKKYLDQLAYYKMNFLHLHLTDDQGWRIEIKSWPDLTAVGAKTEVGGGPGGFYTQEDYRDLVEYAADRFITIVPEVDMPGHTNAASVAYPVLNGNGKTPEPYTGTRVGFSTFDTRKDTVYSFIDDVVREIASLSPGPYFHIGGDESLVTKPADYTYFIERVVPIVRKYGKIPIGWDEVATADLDEEVVAQFWAEEENAEKAVGQGMKVLMSPAKKAYLDMQYDSISRFGLHWAAYIPVDSAYTWSLASYSESIPEDQILGIEAPLWSETISNTEEREYLAFPRLPGYAELGWSAPSNPSWEEYRERLARQLSYFQRKNIKFYPSKHVPWRVPDSQLPWQADER
ncbi:MAG: beta-N-acetylhexosaminidase [Robiginitalea sp.]